MLKEYVGFLSFHDFVLKYHKNYQHILKVPLYSQNLNKYFSLSLLLYVLLMPGANTLP